MFDEATQESLESLGESDLLKVSMMIQKLARKNKTKPQNSTPAERPQEGIASTRPASANARVRTEPVPVGPRENLFEDMEAFHEFKEDEETAKKLYQKPPTPRNRKTNLVSVSCQHCGRSEDKPASIVPSDKNRYICNNCQVRGAKG